MCSKLEQDTADPATRSCTPVSSLSRGHDQQQHSQDSHLMKVFSCLRRALHAALFPPAASCCGLCWGRRVSHTALLPAATKDSEFLPGALQLDRATQHSLSAAGLWWRSQQPTAGWSPCRLGQALRHPLYLTRVHCKAPII